MSRPPFSHRLAHRLQASINWLGDLWNRIVWPVEAAIGKFGEAIFGAFDSFADVEALVVRAVGVLLWPFAAIVRWAGRWLPQGPADGGPSWFVRAPMWIGAQLFLMAERLNLDGVLMLLTRVLTPLWWPIVSVLGCLNAWLATRRPRELALATPALLLAAPFAYVAAQASWQSRSAIETRYQVAAREAIQEGDYARAELLERKLAQLGIDTRRTAYRAGLRLADEGNLAEAFGRMRSIASPDTPGYPAAHAWIAQQLVQREPDTLPSDIGAALAAAEKHLDRLADLDVKNAGIAQLRAFVYVKLDRPAEAIDALEPYATTTLDAAAMRLRLLAATRDDSRARAQAEDLLRIIARERRSDTLQPPCYEAWMLAAQVTDEPTELERSLSAWLQAEPDAEKPRKLLSLLRREQAEELAIDVTANPARVVKLLGEAVQLGASAGWVDRTLARMSPAGRPSARERRAWQAAVASADLPRDLLFAAATRAAGSGEISTARTGYRLLVGRADAGPAAWNNYAWTLLQEPNPEAEKALAAVDKALQSKPNDPRFRETRGQALLSVGRWEEAVGELEVALNAMPDSPKVHAALAQCYEQLAKPQLAAIHRREAGH